MKDCVTPESRRPERGCLSRSASDDPWRTGVPGIHLRLKLLRLRQSALRPASTEPLKDCFPPGEVAQIFNLLYRRIVFGKAGRLDRAEEFARLADCKSAIQQIKNLRYAI